MPRRAFSHAALLRVIAAAAPPCPCWAGRRDFAPAEALAALDSVRATDPQRADADDLRSEIQRQLIALATLPAVPVQSAPARERGDRRVP